MFWSDHKAVLMACVHEGMVSISMQGELNYDIKAQFHQPALYSLIITFPPPTDLCQPWIYTTHDLIHFTVL